MTFGVAEDYLATLAEHAGRLPVGDPSTEDVALGLLINSKQFDQVRGIVYHSLVAGAKGAGRRRGQGAVLSRNGGRRVEPGMRVWQEEIFGPVAPLMTFADGDDAVAIAIAIAIAIANGTVYGLAAGV